MLGLASAVLQRASTRSLLRATKRQSSGKSASATTSVISIISAKAAFHRAVKHGKFKQAWHEYAKGAKVGAIDQYMLAALISLTSSSPSAQKDSQVVSEVVLNRGARVEQLWASVVNASPGTPRLDSHLATTFITSFGTLGNLHMARSVLDAAHSQSLANTIVHNAYLRACSRSVEMAPERGEKPEGVSARASAREHARLEAEEVIGRMEGECSSVAPIDAFTCSLAAALLPSAAAISLLERAGERADAVAYNALMEAAGKAGEIQVALSVLQRMEEGRGPTPTAQSYNTALAGLARLRNHAGGGSEQSQSMDRVAEAMSLRERMAARGIEETTGTRTALLALFGDSDLAETVLTDAESLNSEQRAVRKAEEMSLGRPIWQLEGLTEDDQPLDAPLVLTDLRGLTRAAAAIELRHELTRAAMRLDLGFGASGIGDDTWEESRVRAHWAILAGAEARRKVYENVSRSDRKQGGSTVLRGTPKVTLRTALEFLFAEGIEAEQKKPGLLLVKPDEYAKAATRMSNRMRVQRLKQGLLFYWCVVASGLAAMAVVPRLGLGQVILDEEPPNGIGPRRKAKS